MIPEIFEEDIMKKLLGVSAMAMLTFAAPAFAASNHNEKTVSRDFARLSKDGQHAFSDIAQAQQLLASNQSEKVGQAQSLIEDAEARLTKAISDDRAFVKAESELQPAPGHTPPAHTPNTTPVHWLPVGGQYVVTDALAPEKQTALGNANQHLQQGQTKLVGQDLQVVGTDVDYIVALAPLEPSAGDVHRASVFLDGGDAKDATEALSDALNNILLVSEDVVTTPAPAASPSSAKHHHGA
ncbi:hypothetical protein A0U90_10000 [Kozakia baliensis]|nr:hypothetical protein A0U90_10000 [Kozakia baliensis]